MSELGEKRRKDGGVEVSPNLGGLFGEAEEFTNEYEVQELDIAGTVLKIRQFSWHEANANKVWPGTFTLAEYIVLHMDTYRSGTLLELGAATGALALLLRMPQYSINIVTSDIDDGGAVRDNIAHNFNLNNMACVPHVEHTWGEPWPEHSAPAASFTHIIASDILLYVKAYPALVATLDMLFRAGAQEFLMSWNRRISSTPLFFELMQQAGFVAETLPHCVYSFTRSKAMGAASES